MAWLSWKTILLILVYFRINVLAFLPLDRQPSRPSSRMFSGTVDVEVGITIRDGKYAELDPVSHLVVQSFYDKPNEVFKHLFRLAELNRLQQNFPYADRGRHRMLVAVSKADNEIVGFCDVDNRPATPNNHYKCNPRPILSDLMVNPDCRRQGIARKIVEYCEETCKSVFEKKQEFLYVRVLKDNEGARKMYDGLGYEVFDNPGDPADVVLMRKDLNAGIDE